MFTTKETSFDQPHDRRKPLGRSVVGDGALPPGKQSIPPRRGLREITNTFQPTNGNLDKKVAPMAGQVATSSVFQKTHSFISATSVSVLPQIPTTEPDTSEALSDMNISDELFPDENIMQVESAMGMLAENLQDMKIGLQLHMDDPDDIDVHDVDKPEAVTEYVNDQYSFYKEKEKRNIINPLYMEKQTQINNKMRAILIDWLVDVHYKFKCVPETLYLTINLVDKFLEKKAVPRSKLQLVGVTSFLIACKYEEIYPPEVKELVYITDHAYTRTQILDMESKVLATLKFNVTVCTIHCFLVRYLKAAHADGRIKYLSSYISERTLQEPETLLYLPSMVAASAIYLARKNTGRRPWSPTLAKYTHYSEEDLMPCLRTLSPWIGTKSTLEAVKKKYSTSKYQQVAIMELEGVL